MMSSGLTGCVKQLKTRIDQSVTDETALAFAAYTAINFGTGGFVEVTQMNS